MNDRCPGCKQKVILGKEKLINCPNCSIKILSVTINGNKELIDVTPKDDLKK